MLCPIALGSKCGLENQSCRQCRAFPQPQPGAETWKPADAGCDRDYNPVSSKESLHRWKHWLFQPELRFWRCEPFSGHFLGVHLLAGEYNVADSKLPFGLYKGTRSARYEGSVYGAGISYGYQWILSPRWGLELELGGGYVHASYDRYRCAHCGEKTGSGHKNYLGPTKAAFSIVYLLK